MSIDLFKAFSCVTEDKHWIKKIVIGGVLTLFTWIFQIVAALLPEQSNRLWWEFLIFIITAILILYLTGFIFSTLRKQINEKTNLMSEWSEKNLLLTGFKSFVALTIFTVVWAIIDIIPLLLLLISLSSGNLLISLLGLVCIPIMMLLLLLTYLVLPLFFACYGKTFKILSILDFKRVFIMFKNYQPKVWLLFGLGILYTIIGFIICVIFTISIIGIIALPFLYFYFFIVYNNLIAQFAREIDIDSLYKDKDKLEVVYADNPPQE